MSREDDWGQVDGDESGPAEFKPASAGQPWLRDGMPPWHLWGNTQRISVPVQSSSNPGRRTSTPGQLIKISYKRPETWHWLFAARLISGPNSDGVNSLQLQVIFDLTVGVGRSMVQVLGSPTAINGNTPFEAYFFTWGPLAAIFPANAFLYSTQVLAPNRTFRSDPPFPNQGGFPVAGEFVTGPSVIDQIVAQDLQLNCQLICLATAGDAAIGQSVVVDVSAQFAPKTHMRPDWFRNAPEELIFAGSEVEGR